MAVTVTNTDAGLSGNTLVTGETNQTLTGLKTFSRGVSAPFAVNAGAAKVDNLDADKLDGQTGADYHDASLLTGTIAAISGANVTTLNATNLASGTVPDARFPATLPAASGVNLTALNGTNIASGTVAVARGGTGGAATPTAGGVGHGTGTAHAFTAAGTAGQLVVSGGAGAPTFLNPPLVLLKANSGTTTNAAAENVDTFAITGLTAKDTLVVEYTLQAVTQQTTTITLYNSTDSVVLSDLNSQSGLGALTAGQNVIGESRARQSQDAATAVYSFVVGYKTSNSSVGNAQAATFTTDWTGAWTLALRHGGVTAGGTLRWSWAVYKLAGQ